MGSPYWVTHHFSRNTKSIEYGYIYNYGHRTIVEWLSAVWPKVLTLCCVDIAWVEGNLLKGLIEESVCGVHEGVKT